MTPPQDDPKTSPTIEASPEDLPLSEEAVLAISRFAGTWMDEDDDLVRIGFKDGRPEVAMWDPDDGETYGISEVAWKRGALSWLCAVPSTGFVLQYRTVGLSYGELKLQWKNIHHPDQHGEEQLSPADEVDAGPPHKGGGGPKPA